MKRISICWTIFLISIFIQAAQDTKDCNMNPAFSSGFDISENSFETKYFYKGLNLNIILINPRNTKKADQAYEIYQFNIAAKLYKKLYSKEKEKKTKSILAFKIGECYFRMNSYKKAELWFIKAIKLRYSDPIVLYQLAKVQKRQNKYVEAKQTLTLYKKEMPGDHMIETLISYCDSAVNWMNVIPQYTVESSRSLNSKYNDFSPSYYKNGSIIITSDREKGTTNNLYDWTGLPFTDIYISKWDKRRSRLTKPELIDGLNTPFNEGVVTFNKRYTVIYYTQCNGKDGKLHNCRIMMARRKGNGWSEPIVLPFCNDSFTNYGHPALTTDGKKLYFSSNMVGSYGEDNYGGKWGHTSDLYVSKWIKRGRLWSDPVNLGPTINTNGDERFPFISEDGTLYFSSDGHPGMGGLDVYYSKGSGTQWSNPINMKYPINSCSDDFGIVIKNGSSIYRGIEGYLSSNRPGSKGDDIYHFSCPPIEFNLEGIVTNKRTLEAEAFAHVYLSNLTKDTIMQFIADSNGWYKFSKLNPRSKYSVIAEKENFFSGVVKRLSTKGYTVSHNFIRNLDLTYFTDSIVLEGIRYGLDSADIRPESALVLDSLVKTLNKYPYIIIELASHTDCRADSLYNIELSQRRADSCVDYLVRKGIDPDRLVSKGYGENMLVNDCDCEDGKHPNFNCTEEEYQINRRTTFRVLRMGFESKLGENKMDIGKD